MQLTKEIKHIFNSLHDYGVWQHEQSFPWMDSFPWGAWDPPITQVVINQVRIP